MLLVRDMRWCRQVDVNIVSTPRQVSPPFRRRPPRRDQLVEVLDYHTVEVLIGERDKWRGEWDRVWSKKGGRCRRGDFVQAMLL